jgi:hypothetical protein
MYREVLDLTDYNNQYQFLARLNLADLRRELENLRNILYSPESKKAENKNSPDKLTVPEEAYVLNARPLSKEEEEMQLAKLDITKLGIQAKEAYLFRKGYLSKEASKLGDSNYVIGSLSYDFLPDPLHSVRQLSLAETDWLLCDDGTAISNHRVVFISMRGLGVGELMLKLSKQALKASGMEKMLVKTQRLATASWFFKQGFYPDDSNDLSIEYLKAVLEKENDYSKTLSSKINLSKALD